MTDKQREIVMEAHALVGVVSTGFSNLEYHLQFVLVLLISNREDSPEAFLTLRDKQFSQKINLLKDLVALKFSKGSTMYDTGIDLRSRLDKLRVTRNLYIHGYWIINFPLIQSTGGVRCLDTRWKFDKKSDSWGSMKPLDISLDELRSQIKETTALFKDLFAYNELVRSDVQKK